MKIKENDKIKTAADLERTAKIIAKENSTYSKIVTICAGTGCSASGCQDVISALRMEIKRRKLDKKIKIRTTGRTLAETSESPALAWARLRAIKICWTRLEISMRTPV